MHSKHKKLITFLCLITMFITSSIVIYFYWSVDDFESIHNLPVHTMATALAYLIANFIRKQLDNSKKWWDWMYFPGLAAMMYPVLAGKEEQLYFLSLLTDFGTLFLLIPVFMEGKKIIQQLKEKQ
jgi:hypothetical protein